MKNKLFTLSLLFSGCLIDAQVGINTSSPDGTLDVVGFPAIVNKLDGIIAPRLTETELNKKTYTAAQTGALVYVTLADIAPTGQTVSVTAPGYYYFDGNQWQKQTGNDWHVTGNAVGEILTRPETLGAAPVSDNYLGPIGAADLVMISADKVHAVLDTSGALAGGGEGTSTLSWGNSNIINNTSNNIALGTGNTANASSANFPAVAIGSANNVAGGGKAFGVGNSTLLTNNFAFGANNKTGASIAVGVGYGNDALTGGFAFGATNKVTLNGFAFGSNNEVTATRGVAIGIGGKATGDQSVYANTTHAFLNQSNTAGAIVGINMIPTASRLTGAAIQLNGIAPSGAGTNDCTANEEGAIRYNSTLKVHEGCNGNGVWKALY
ncbi:MAG: hypothetical protein MUW56_07100 [Chryseobacterium sp.]|uniref:hypothetical protein n=1 Tax=Chryseobacterium sp. TaxID=1871047 RepID=UPI0025BAF547|nr:hypothetical protein [Chryseobacterium sp.]MCJ7933400.1 hypothetical protein [Chryseobacterium sp.]